MKWKKCIAAGIIAAALVVMQALPVFAAEQSKVTLKSEKWENNVLKVSCMIEGDDTITNGKLRIKYNPQELALQKTEAGEIVSGTLVQINDCLVGNKEPGEIVFVFANAEPLEADGSLVDMTFQAGESFDEKNGSEIQVSVEELSSDGTEVETRVENSVVGTEMSTGENPGGDSGDGGENTPGGDNGEDTTDKPDGNTDKPDENSGSTGNSGAGNQSGAEGSSTGGNSTGGSSAGGSSTGERSEDKNQAGTSQTSKTAAKTGDSSNPAAPAAAGGIALALIGGTLVYRRKKLK